MTDKNRQKGASGFVGDELTKKMIRQLNALPEFLKGKPDKNGYIMGIDPANGKDMTGIVVMGKVAHMPADPLPGIIEMMSHRVARSLEKDVNNIMQHYSFNEPVKDTNEVTEHYDKDGNLMKLTFTAPEWPDLDGENAIDIEAEDVTHKRLNDGSNDSL